jgi:Uma2 family endonuclease
VIVKLSNPRVFVPADHGRRMSYKQFTTSPWQEGLQYELIDGRVYASPSLSLPHDRLVEWLDRILRWYAKRKPEVINRVSQRARVFVPGRPATTCPEPDLAAYHDFPYQVSWRNPQWEDVSPVLVGEVASKDLAKDFGRNVDLYEQVPSIREYWLVHGGDNDAQFLFRAYRRRGQKWQKPIDLGFGDTYTTRLLPGLKLRIKPDA